MAEYVVLRLDEIPDSRGWSEIGRVSANGSAQAIRVALEGKPAVSLGTYVAVPVRSWNPVTVKTETKTVLKLGEAT